MTTVGLYFWDQLTAVTLTNPEVVTFEAHCIEIVIDLENHEGQTNSTDIGTANALVAVSANPYLFENLFIGYINNDLPTSSTPTGTSTPPPLDLSLWIVLGSGVAIVGIIALTVIKKR